MKKEESFIKEQAETLLARMNIPVEGKVEESREDKHYRVELAPKDREDLPLLIGYHGQTLNALQVILGLLTFRKFGEFTPLLVEAGDYRKEREAELQRRALEAADKARFLLKEVSFPAMPPFERRIVHMTLTDESGVRTESRGEGRERHVVVIPEGKK
jgi:spoIIIJ-associated protein